MKMNFKDKEINKIIEFSEFMGVKGISFVENLNSYTLKQEDPVYSPSQNIIILPTDICEEYLKYALLHELGHYREDVVNRFPWFWAYHHNTTQPYQTPLQTIEEEFRAWTNAEKIAKILNIKLGSSYKKFKKQCLDSHLARYEDSKPRTQPDFLRK